MHVGAAAQGIMFGYARGEMRDELLLPQQAVCTSTRMFCYVGAVDHSIRFGT